MRGEAKHQAMKKLVKTNKCLKNLCLTLAEKHQINLAISVELHGIPSSMKIVPRKESLEIGSVVFAKNLFVVVSFDDESSSFLFSKIISVKNGAGSVVLKCKDFKTVGFSHFFRSYVVSPSSSLSFRDISPDIFSFASPLILFRVMKILFC